MIYINSIQVDKNIFIIIIPNLVRLIIILIDLSHKDQIVLVIKARV